MIKANVNEVLVPVVVRNAQGQVVGNLKKENFQIYDSGKLQTVAGFTVVERADSGPDTSPTATPGSAPATAQPVRPGQRFIVLLFDVMNLTDSDLAQTRDAANNMLAASLRPTDFAAVLSTAGTNSGVTRDREKLQKAIQDLRLNSLYHHDSHECPNVDYYQADLIVNKNDGIALQAAAEDTLSCANLDRSQMSIATHIAENAAQRAAALGDQNFRANLNFIKLVVGKMNGLPGQRLLILISSGFLTPTAEALTLKSQVLDTAAQANVVISTIDARGLYTTNLDPSQHGGGSPLGIRMQNEYHQASMEASEDVMADLADGTGGAYFHGNNNLEAGLDQLFAGPRYLYLLSFVPGNVKSNGGYRALKVKVDQPGMNVQARRGYFAPAQEKKKE
jgi:VWFA-related protein